MPGKPPIPADWLQGPTGERTLGWSRRTWCRDHQILWPDQDCLPGLPARGTSGLHHERSWQPGCCEDHQGQGPIEAQGGRKWPSDERTPEAAAGRAVISNHNIFN